MCINERFINCTRSCYFKDCLALMNDYAVVTAFLTLQRLPCSIAAITVQHLGQSSHSTQAAIYTWALQCCRASCSIPRLPAGPSKRASRAPGAPSSVEMVL